MSCGVTNVLELDELTFIKELHIGYGSVNCHALLSLMLAGCLDRLYCLSDFLAILLSQLGRLMSSGWRRPLLVVRCYSFY